MGGWDISLFLIQGIGNLRNEPLLSQEMGSQRIKQRKGSRFLKPKSVFLGLIFSTLGRSQMRQRGPLSPTFSSPPIPSSLS